jgi:amino acid transporter
MAYEGFQLLTYDYEDIDNPKKTLPRAVMSAVIAVLLVYVLVALGATMLVGARTIVDSKEVAIAVAGRQALGIWGLGLATVAAAFSTGSAINATLFATARLMHEVAKDRELPPVLCHRNENGVPDRPVMIIGATGALLAVAGSLEALVEAASLTFLFTFAAVNVIAFFQISTRRWVFTFGAAGAGVAGVILVFRLISEAPMALGLLTVVGLVAIYGRPKINRWTEKLHDANDSK